MNLSEQQKQRIADNRKRAQEKLAKKRASLINQQAESYHNMSSNDPGYPAATLVTKAEIERKKFEAAKRLHAKNLSVTSDNAPFSNYNLPHKTDSCVKQGINIPTPQYKKLKTSESHIWSKNKRDISIHPLKLTGVTSTTKYPLPSKNLSSFTMNESSKTKHPNSRLNLQAQCKLISRERFEVDTTYHPALIEVFKSMKSKLYDGAKRKWTFLLQDHDSLVKACRGLEPEVKLEALPRAVIKAFSRQLRGDYHSSEVHDNDLTCVDNSLVNSLLMFQREGVNFGISKQGRLLLADDMGLGKTIQAICLAQYYREDWPVFVVTPSSVRFHWAQQIKHWLPSLKAEDVYVITRASDAMSTYPVNIISYDIMRRQAEFLKKCYFGVVIMDECHMLKNIKTARTKAALPIIKKARRVILLSGTPALSRPLELYTLITALSPDLISYHDFGRRYCDGKQQPWGWDYSGSSNLTELQLLLEETIMIRRIKRDVMKQLPPKIRQLIQLDPGSIKDTKSLQTSSAIMHSKQLKGCERHGALLEYFHQTGNAKVSAVCDYVTDFIDCGRKMLVFAHHKEVLDAIDRSISSILDSKYIRIDGSTPSELRTELCDMYQHRDDVQVALLSITAGNAGLDLSAANVVIFAELFWNPGILVQAEDRAHRIGQEDSVSIQYLVAPGTADDHIWPLIQTKLDVLGKAGLAKDNFSDFDTIKLTSNLEKNQPTLDSYLQPMTMSDTVMDDTLLADMNEFMDDGQTVFDTGQMVAGSCIIPTPTSNLFTKEQTSIHTTVTTTTCFSHNNLHLHNVYTQANLDKSLQSPDKPMYTKCISPRYYAETTSVMDDDFMWLDCLDGASAV